MRVRFVDHYSFVDGDRWITVHPNGKENKGTPVKLDGSTGEVLAGMGGRFNGRHISSVPKRGKEEQHGAQAKIDRAKYLEKNPDYLNNRNDQESFAPKPEKSQARKQWEGELEGWKQDLQQRRNKNSFDACCDRIGISGLVPDKDSLMSLDPKQLQVLTESSEDVFSKYPKLQNYVVDKGGSLKSNYLGENTFAQCYFADLTINSKFFSRRNYLVRECKQLRNSGWMTDFKDSFADKATLYHEYGHLIHNLLIQKEFEPWFEKEQEKDPYVIFDPKVDEKRQSMIGRHVDAILEIASKKLGVSPDDVTDRYMSGYGKTTNAEFFAEAFCNLHGGKINPIGEAIGIYLERELSK